MTDRYIDQEIESRYMTTRVWLDGESAVRDLTTIAGLIDGLGATRSMVERVIETDPRAAELAVAIDSAIGQLATSLGIYQQHLGTSSAAPACQD